ELRIRNGPEHWVKHVCTTGGAIFLTQPLEISHGPGSSFGPCRSLTGAPHRGCGIAVASIFSRSKREALSGASVIMETRVFGEAKLSVPTGMVPVTDFDLRLLRVFKTIVEEGGLKPAQAALEIGLPTISKYLSDLEARFGVRLCRRGSQRFELTREGE